MLTMLRDARRKPAHDEGGRRACIETARYCRMSASVEGAGKEIDEAGGGG